MGSSHNNVPTVLFQSSFRGYNSHAIRFWSAGALPPFRFWPAGTTEKEWQSWSLEHSQHEPSHTNPRPQNKTCSHNDRSIAKAKPKHRTRTKPKHRTRKQHVKRVDFANPIAAQSEVASMCDVDSIGSKPAGGAEKENRLLASESARPEAPPGLSPNEVSSCAYYNNLQHSVQVPGFDVEFTSALSAAVRKSTSLASSSWVWDEDSDARSDSSAESSQSMDEHEVSLADLFHDSITFAQNRLNRSWSDWVHIAEVVHEMQKLVTQSHTSIRNEWALEEQVEASVAFAEAYKSIGVVSIKVVGSETEVCFAKEPIDSMPEGGANEPVGSMPDGGAAKGEGP